MLAIRAVQEEGSSKYGTEGSRIKQLKRRASRKKCIRLSKSIWKHLKTGLARKDGFTRLGTTQHPYEMGWQYEQDEFEYGFGLDVIDRMLAGDESTFKDESAFDYTILNYGIWTLYLVLFVEFVRHSVNHAAHGRPFFTAVLSMAYSELATLGIVEFGVFLWGKYGYIQKDRKAKFADVHFALFFTAIFNAFQYGLTSIFSTRKSNKMWVKTEQLELDHYVEIRLEYDRVNKIIENQCRGFFGKLDLFVCRSGLRRQHEKLRVQVKFHELRLHFLEFNNLPFSLKVSDYLKRSELSILIGLVHVSATTWVLLIALMNLAYFILGMIEIKTSSPGLSTPIMFGILFAIDFIFIALCLALRWKMRRIFQQVLKRKVIGTSDHEEGIKNQKQLFWFGSPALVIYMIQLMNFGYALSFSIVIIYSEYLNETHEIWVGIPAEIAFPATTLFCYFVFLSILSALLPEFTLCTSLGYLTNRKELDETLAMHRLEEAERQHRRKLIEKATVNDTSIFQSHPVDTSINVTAISGVGVEQKRLPSDLRDSVGGILSTAEEKEAPLLLSDLVKIDTEKLQSRLPEESREKLISRQERRHNRQKSLSDGVSAMRAWNQGQSPNSQEKQEITTQNRRSRRKAISQPGVIQGWQKLTVSEQRKNMKHSVNASDAAKVVKESKREKSNSDPRTIKDWKEKVESDELLRSKDDGPIFLRKGGTIINGGSGESIPAWKKERLERLAARKRARKKTQSASAIIQSWQDYSIREPPREHSETILNENCKPGDRGGSSFDDGSRGTPLYSTLKATIDSEGKVNDQTPYFEKRLSLHTLIEDEAHNEVSLRDGDICGSKSDRNTVIDLSDAVIIDDGERDFNKRDDGTVDTGKSIGNLSDVDVVDIDTTGISSFTERGLQAERDDASSYQGVLIRKARLYFIGPMYPYVSHVLGTSIVFYLVGHRVESFRQNQGGESPFSDKAWFWLEATMFLCFLVADFIIIALFPFWKENTKTERRLVFATIADLLIVTAVTTLFFVAEAKRCCMDEIAVAQIATVRERNLVIGKDDLVGFGCTCPEWGVRTYGGIGMIEPFTCLIVLRLFRFYFAEVLIRSEEIYLRRRPSNEVKNMHETQQNHDNARVNQHSHCRGNVHQSGTALELWERAMAEFPDIVEKYGQFSGELLQAMLGLQFAVVAQGTSASTPPNASTIEHEQKRSIDSRQLESHIMLAGSRHTQLPPRVQALIIAGQLGKPVKPMNPGLHQNPATLVVAAESTSAKAMRPVEFEVDFEQMKCQNNVKYEFIAPFARLVRSMRRCDRRHLPLLKGWTSVDVVMTQFEIVYFEAIDSLNSIADEETKIHSDACRLALEATKGGKNLRLCDVAQGRTVVGHLDLADVTEVHVERDDTPVSDVSLVENDGGLLDKDQDLAVEHWSNPCSETEANKKYSRIIRWSLCQESRLRISTKAGKLFLRFYSDLALFEANNSGEAKTISNCLTREISFQWAQTVCRICGRSQLEQNLPNFGENNEEELQDYLEVVHFHEKEAEEQSRNIARTANRMANTDLLFLGAKGSNAARKKVKHKRTKSMVDLRGAITADKSDVAFGNTAMNVISDDESTMQARHRDSKRVHRVSRSMVDFISVTGTEQVNEPDISFPFAMELNEAEKHV